MELQVYAIGKDGKLAWAAPKEFNLDAPLQEQALRHETAWRRWRNKYVKDNPGNYPLADRRNGYTHRIVLADGSTVELKVRP